MSDFGAVKRVDVVEATPEHAEQMGEILLDARIKQYSSHISEHEILHRHDDIGGYTGFVTSEISKSRFSQVAVIGKEVIGFVIARDDENDSENLHVSWLYSKPDYRGMGFGGLLMDRTEERARELGRSFLSLFVWDQNSDAIEFYKNRGFSGEGKIKTWFGMAKFMNKNIDESYEEYLLRAHGPKEDWSARVDLDENTKAAQIHEKVVTADMKWPRRQLRRILKSIRALRRR